MKCPKCGQEMESGYLDAVALGARAIVPSVSLSWKDNRKENTETLGTRFGIFGGVNMYVEAFRCPLCQIIAFPYVRKEKKEFQEETKPQDYSYDDVEKYLR